MPSIPKGQFFLDLIATKHGQQKGKFFIALTEGEFDDDRLICFVLNTENRMDLYRDGCNKAKGKFILLPDNHDFGFLINPTSIMLNEPCCYLVKEFYEDRIIMKKVADEKILREIKNCIDNGYLLPWMIKDIKSNYRINR